MISNLLVVEYMTPDGEILVDVECYDTAGETLEMGKFLELLEVAKAKALAPMWAQRVAQFCLENPDG